MKQRLTPLHLYAGSIALLVMIAIGALLIVKDRSVVPPLPTPSAGMATLEGSVTCLPHKDTSGPTTLECAFGLRLDNGTHVALDTILYPSSILSEISTESRIAVTGLYTPVEALSDSSLQKYAIVGVLKVSDVQKK